MTEQLELFPTETSVPQFDTITGPAYWACYFINGDGSGMTDDELAQADAWLVREGVRVIDVARDDESGEAMEPWFTWSYALHAPEAGCQGGDVVDYVVEYIA